MAGDKSEPSKLAEHWISWWVALAAIGIPVFVLLAWKSIGEGSLVWSGVASASERGDFLVPVVILCIESLRRWWVLNPVDRARNLELKFTSKRLPMETIRRTAIVVCGFAGAVACVATIYSANQSSTDESSQSASTPSSSQSASTDKSSQSINFVTISGLMASVGFGTMVLKYSDPKANE
jgi:hypothetical protein